jgi:hypothetical protein
MAAVYMLLHFSVPNDAMDNVKNDNEKPSTWNALYVTGG